MSFYDALDLENLATNPLCTHGPTILFENRNQKKKFYSCSAIRNHKTCNFYQEQREFTDQELRKWSRIYKRSLVKYSVSKELRLKARSIELKKRIYCQTCDKFILSKKEKNVCNKEKHTMLRGVKKSALKAPTKILNPIVDDEFNAQFFFNDRSLEYFRAVITECSFDSVLCIGTPTLYEAIQEPAKKMLLDIDDRFMQFYSKKSFLRYNMFNNHFFHGKKSYLNFIRNSKKLLIIIDPPYGGLVKLIANTINKMTGECKELGVEASFLLIYPYFMETWISRWLPDFKMLDFKVTYQNQKNFGENASGKGSSARAFTNISELGINQVEIPRIDELKDYYFCELCKKYTFLQNKHCLICNKCTSKDGGYYKHCDVCARCVKNSYLHCKLCNICHLKDSNCRSFEAKSLRCFKCNSLEHKSRECYLYYELSPIVGIPSG